MPNIIALYAARICLLDISRLDKPSKRSGYFGLARPPRICEEHPVYKTQGIESEDCSRNFARRNGRIVGQIEAVAGLVDHVSTVGGDTVFHECRRQPMGLSTTRSQVAAVVIGSQLVNQDLGFSRNIFQTVSAEAEDVGFGQHLGARGAFFVNRYLGAEAGFTRTTTDFEFSVTDEEAGFTVFPEPLEQVSQEASVSAVLQWPRAAVTPYGVVGYAWRTSEVEGAEPFESGAVVVGIGIKVPFPGAPVLLAFDYRRIEFRDEEADALRLAEGGVGSPTVSALTLGIVVRLNVNR